MKAKITTSMFFLIFGLLVLSLPSLSLDVYTWIDEEGEVHFTDSPEKIPPQYQDNYIHRELKDSSKPKKQPHPSDSDKGGDKGTTIQPKKNSRPNNYPPIEENDDFEGLDAEEVPVEDLDLIESPEEPLSKDEEETDEAEFSGD